MVLDLGRRSWTAAAEEASAPRPSCWCCGCCAAPGTAAAAAGTAGTAVAAAAGAGRESAAEGPSEGAAGDWTGWPSWRAGQADRRRVFYCTKKLPGMTTRRLGRDGFLSNFDGDRWGADRIGEGARSRSSGGGLLERLIDARNVVARWRPVEMGQQVDGVDGGGMGVAVGVRGGDSVEPAAVCLVARQGKAGRDVAGNPC